MFQKVNQIVMFAFMAIGLILMIMTMGIETTEDGCVNCGAEGLFIGFSYFLLVITLIAALAGTAMTAVSDPGKMKGDCHRHRSNDFSIRSKLRISFRRST